METAGVAASSAQEPDGVVGEHAIRAPAVSDNLDIGRQSTDDLGGTIGTDRDILAATSADGWRLAPLLLPYLILIGILVNAAAPPLSAWLADAYPESSPTGSVFLSAFTTKTAVYVLIRGYPGFDILIWFGVFMIFYGIVYALLENDAGNRVQALEYAFRALHIAEGLEERAPLGMALFRLTQRRRTHTKFCRSCFLSFFSSCWRSLQQSSPPICCSGALRRGKER